MFPRSIPEDINIETLLSYFPEGSVEIKFAGLHKRNAYNDILSAEEKTDGTVIVDIGRNSLYHVLPEYLFHSIDRYDYLPKLEEKERFAEEYEKQEKEKENARRFFAPIDILLLQLRMFSKERIEELTANNKVLLDILGDRLTEDQKANRFIRQAILFLPYCKYIRGNKTLLTFLLRKILMEEGITIREKCTPLGYKDDEPQYSCTLGAVLDECYVGNEYHELVTVYELEYWPEDDCDEHFLQYVDDLEVFRCFIQDYMMSIEAYLQFNLIDRHAMPLRISDERVFNYLNYNTNI